MGTKYDPIPLVAQPGFLLTQSPLASKGQFTAGFGVRFRNNFPEKRAGFSALTTMALTGIPRGSFAWNDLTGRELIGVGTATNLYAIPDTNYVPMDITPPGLVAGYAYQTQLSGFGTGYFGRGTFGRSQPGQFIVAPPRIWSMGNFGRVGLFCPGGPGGIYSWDPASLAGTAALVPNAPTLASGLVSTSDNLVLAYGTNFNSANPAQPGPIDPLQIWNSAQGDYTNWNTLAIAGPNGAPSQVRRINEGNAIIASADLGTHITLFWTDFSLHVLQYTGSQFVFDEYPVGLQCGLIGPMAFAVVNSTAYWMSTQGFFVYSGGVTAIPNQDNIREFVFGSITQTAIFNIVCWYDQFFNEVSWAIPINGSLENSITVIYNISGQFWYTDTMIVQRTSATSLSSPITNPLFFGTNGLLYEDNVTLDANGVHKPWSITYAPVESGSFGSAQVAVVAGQAWIEALGVFLDMQRQVGSVTATIVATDRTQPGSPIIDTSTGTADPTTSAIDMRVAGRELALTLSGDGLGCDFRLGVPRIEMGISGTRR